MATGLRKVPAALLLGLAFVFAAAAFAGMSGASSASVRSARRPPKIIPPADVTAEASGPRGAVVRYRPARAPGAVTIRYSKRSGTLFPLGRTIVIVRAANRAGESATARFKVTVVDTKPPSITATSDATVEASGPSGANVGYPLPIAADVVDGPVPVDCSPAAGTLFPLGATTVTCSARDAAGNGAGATFTVKVVDTTPPSIDRAADIAVTATGVTGAVVSYPPGRAIDVVDGVVAVECSPASGTAFAVGATTVACSARDAAGNKATSSFTVTVKPRGVARPGHYTGTTSQEGRISFDVSSDGLRMSNVGPPSPCIVGAAECQFFLRFTCGTPPHTEVLIDGPRAEIIAINIDGSFVYSQTTANNDFSLSGRITDIGQASGRMRLEIQEPSCSSGDVSWTAALS